MRMYCLRLAHSYSPTRRIWSTSVGEVNYSSVAHLFTNQEILAKIVSFCEGVSTVLKDGGNNRLFALLKVLALLDARVSGLEDMTTINTFRERYLLLIKHYLESRFSFLHAHRYLAEVMKVCEDLDELGGKDLLEFFSCHTVHFKPLITEFLAL
jgi:hypothetical protein